MESWEQLLVGEKGEEGVEEVYVGKDRVSGGNEEEGFRVGDVVDMPALVDEIVCGEIVYGGCVDGCVNGAKFQHGTPPRLPPLPLREGIDNPAAWESRGIIVSYRWLEIGDEGTDLQAEERPVEADRVRVLAEGKTGVPLGTDVGCVDGGSGGSR